MAAIRRAIAGVNEAGDACSCCCCMLLMITSSLLGCNGELYVIRTHTFPRHVYTGNITYHGAPVSFVNTAIHVPSCLSAHHFRIFRRRDARRSSFTKGATTSKIKHAIKQNLLDGQGRARREAVAASPSAKSI